MYVVLSTTPWKPTFQANTYGHAYCPTGLAETPRATGNQVLGKSAPDRAIAVASTVVTPVNGAFLSLHLGGVPSFGS